MNKDMNADAITNNAKITLIWRSLSTLASLLLVTGVGVVVNNSNAADQKQNKIIEKLDNTSSDVAQIKWELPVIKKTAETDKIEVLRQIQNIEDRLKSMRETREMDRKDIALLMTELAVIKQQLNRP